MFNDYFRSKVYRFILRSRFAQGSVGLWRVVAVRKVLFREGDLPIAPTM